MLSLLLLLLVFGLIVNYRKTIIIYAPLKLFILNSVVLSGFWTFNTVCSLIIIIFCVFNNLGRIKRIIKGYPLRLSTFLLIFSSICSSLLLGFRLQPIITAIVLTYGFCVVLYYCIQTPKDISLLLIVLLIGLIIMLVNARLEMAGWNPIGDFFIKNSPKDTFFADNSVYERGLRLQSMFPHSIVFGTVCVMLAYLYSFVFIKIRHTYLLFIPISALLFFMILTNSRTPIIAMIILFVGLLLQRRMFSKNGIITMIVVVPVLFFLSGYIEFMFDSIMGQNSNISGSTIEMRQMQLGASLKIASGSSIFGIGNKDISNFSNELLGAESVWFQLLINKGYFGIFVYIIMYIDMIRRALFNENKYFLLTLCVGWLVANTASNMSGMDDYCFYLLFFIIYKNGLFRIHGEVANE